MAVVLEEEAARREVDQPVDDLEDLGLVGARGRAADRRQDHPAVRQLRRAGRPEVRPARPAPGRDAIRPDPTR